jgi:membrane-bound lytic murein transglycosylase A
MRKASTLARLILPTLLLAFAVSPLDARKAEWTVPQAQLTPVAFAELPGWEADNHAAAFDTFLASCRSIVTQNNSASKNGARAARPIDAPLRSVCRAALALGATTAAEARAFLEKHFQAVEIRRQGEAEGFLTGYYEPIVAGSRVPTGEFKVPLYRRPHDLIPGARRHGADFPNKGGAFRRVGKKKLVPYYDRGEIEDGALDGKGLEICWVRDPVDAFFIQIQGSARIRLEDGAYLRLNYAAHNGHPYTPVGAHLANRGIIPREEMSMDRIRAWMQANPEEAKELRRQNRAFVFFRIAALADHEEAVGAQGVPLTAGRSLAVDRKLHTYGTPFWIDAELPLNGDAAKDRFRRLMIAQDTGSAIVGPARGDLYFGAGEEQGRIAGRIRHPGRFVMLVPAALKPVTVVMQVPMPRPRPRT